MGRKTSTCFVFAALLLAVLLPTTVAAQDIQCDSAYQNCRTPLIQLIRNETRGIDIAQWFIRDSWVVDEIIKKHQAGVPVRFIVDPRSDENHEGSMEAITAMAAAGIPLRAKTTGAIAHWKVFIFVGQHIVKFGGANLTAVDYVPVDPYKNYRNETNIILKDPVQVSSFKTKFEDKWLSTSLVDYANITPELKLRRYPIAPIDTVHLGFGPEDPFSTRLITLIDRETVAIDVSVLRFGLSSLTDALIRAYKRGVKVRVNTEQAEYRLTTRYLHAHALDKLYMAGIPIRWRNHNGQNHEKTMLLHGQGVMWTGSSNWTSSSDKGGQLEHNYFTDPTETDWFQHYFDRFERRWWNEKWVNGVRMIESKPFVPLPPGKAVYKSPVNGFVGTPTSIVINGGYYGFYADVYFGTTSVPPLYKANVPLGVNKNISVALPVLTRGKTYYWRVNNKTFANKVTVGSVYSFRVP